MVLGTTDREAIEHDLEAFGLRLEAQLRDESVEVWPEHWDCMEVASAMMSQMQVGFAGPVGWRYEALPVVFRLLGIGLKRQREMFDDLRVLESDVIHAMRDRK